MPTDGSRMPIWHSHWKERRRKNACYSELKYEIAIISKMRKVEVIPVVIGALGTVIKHFEKFIEKLYLDLTIEALQKPCLLGTARIIGKALDIKWKKKLLQYLRQLVGVCYCGIFLPGNKIRTENKINNNINSNNNNNNNNNKNSDNNK